MVIHGLEERVILGLASANNAIDHMHKDPNLADQEAGIALSSVSPYFQTVGEAIHGDHYHRDALVDGVREIYGKAYFVKSVNSFSALKRDPNLIKTAYPAYLALSMQFQGSFEALKKINYQNNEHISELLNNYVILENMLLTREKGWAEELERNAQSITFKPKSDALRTLAMDHYNRALIFLEKMETIAEYARERKISLGEFKEPLLRNGIHGTLTAKLAAYAA